MTQRLDKFLYNGEVYDKKNHFVFTTIVDRNGFALTKYPFIQEYFTRIHDFIKNDTQIICDRYAFDDSKLHEILTSNFFRVVHSKKILEHWKDPEMERARVPKTNHMFFKSLAGALHSTEEYFDGIIWFFGNFKMFETIAPMINRVFIVRLNCDFGELCPELLDIDGVYDEHLFSSFNLTHKKIMESEQSIEWVKTMNKPVETRVEVVSEHMKLVTKAADVREERKDIPMFHDYQFEEYALTSKFKLSRKRQKEVEARKEAKLHESEELQEID
ncbi:gp211 [Sphingomonas phage PAU]|uniref:gp211 n=1 Tax=Sphingomonas phage PAU TaxID=1150991 RepID=UPI0002573371|nr:gp211 [Sphingomonas phage PAU]AFF28209.1 gp211 [Sphingomonas phage PAU]